MTLTAKPSEPGAGTERKEPVVEPEPESNGPSPNPSPSRNPTSSPNPSPNPHPSPNPPSPRRPIAADLGRERAPSANDFRPGPGLPAGPAAVAPVPGRGACCAACSARSGGARARHRPRCVARGGDPALAARDPQPTIPTPAPAPNPLPRPIPLPRHRPTRRPRRRLIPCPTPSRRPPRAFASARPRPVAAARPGPRARARAPAARPGRDLARRGDGGNGRRGAGRAADRRAQRPRRRAPPPVLPRLTAPVASAAAVPTAGQPVVSLADSDEEQPCGTVTSSWRWPICACRRSAWGPGRASERARAAPSRRLSPPRRPRALHRCAGAAARAAGRPAGPAGEGVPLAPDSRASRRWTRPQAWSTCASTPHARATRALFASAIGREVGVDVERSATWTWKRGPACPLRRRAAGLAGAAPGRARPGLLRRLGTQGGLRQGAGARSGHGRGAGAAATHATGEPPSRPDPDGERPAWTVLDIEVPGGYAGAVAARGRGAGRCSCHQRQERRPADRGRLPRPHA